MGSEVEQTLFRCPEVDVFKVPPRNAAGGVRSGEWRLADRIFTGRLRVVGIAGERLEVRLEDTLRSGREAATSLPHPLLCARAYAAAMLLPCDAL